MGLKQIVLPEANRRDLDEVDPQVRKKLKFAFVSDVEQLLPKNVDTSTAIKMGWTPTWKNFTWKFLQCPRIKRFKSSRPLCRPQK